MSDPIKSIILLFTIVVFAGCSTYAVSRYSISADNVTALRALDKTVSVGDFTSFEPGLSEIMCRGVGPIKTPDGTMFSEFVRKAFIDELQIAERYAVTAPIILTGHLDKLDFSSTSGEWNLGLTLNSSNGQSITVTEDYEYTSSYYGESACNQTAQALMPAVQNLIRKVVTNPAFANLVG